MDESADNGFEITTDNGEINVVTVKKAVQKEGYIVRLFNNSEKENAVVLKCGNVEKRFVFGKFEVKTVLYNAGGLTEFADMYI